MIVYGCAGSTVGKGDSSDGLTSSHGTSHVGQFHLNRDPIGHAFLISDESSGSLHQDESEDHEEGGWRYMTRRE